METSWCFFTGGKLYNIDMTEGETKARYGMRVGLILSSIQKMPLSELIKLSHMYADLAFLGVQPSSENKTKIYWLLGIEKKKPEKSPEEDEVALEDAKAVLTSETIQSVDSAQVVTETKATFTPLGEEAFIHIPGNDKEEILNQTIHDVVLKQSSEDGQTAGPVIQVAVETVDGIEIVELKSCADPKCDEPAPVMVNHPEVGISVIIDPIEVSAPSHNEEAEIFGDPTAKNAFLMPDMECYNLNAGDDPDETMRECVLKRFRTNHVLRMKLRGTRNRPLIYNPTEKNDDLTYWATSNRYGEILMSVRSTLAPQKDKKFSTAIELKEVTQKYIDLPMSQEVLDAYRINVMNSAGIKNGVIPEYTPEFLMDIFKAYDMEMFDGHLEGMINADGLHIIFKWTEDDVPCGLDVGDNNTFHLEPSRKIFASIPADLEHKVFGVNCNSSGMCLLIFVESFIATIAHELSEVDETFEQVAQDIFIHTSTEVKFASKPVEKPEVPNVMTAETVQKMLRDAQKVDEQADVFVTIKDIGRVIMVSARRQTALKVKSTGKEGDPVLTQEQQDQPYMSVTHIGDIQIQ